MTIKNRKILLILFRRIILVTIALPYTSIAAEPKFIMNFDECMNVIAPLYLTKTPSIKKIDGTSFILSCVTKSKIINCQMDFMDGGKGIKGNIVEYEIQLDAPPLLLLKLNKGTENIIIDTSKNAVVLSSLLLDTTFAGSKVCHGSYFTYAQLKNNEK